MDGDGQVDPDGRAVVADEALLHRVAGQLAPQKPAVQLEVGRQVVGMGELHPCLRTHLLAGVAEDLAELLVNAQEAALEVNVVNTDGRVLERAAKQRFALAKGLLGPLASVMSRARDTKNCRPPSQKFRLLTSTGKTVPSLRRCRVSNAMVSPTLIL